MVEKEKFKCRFYEKMFAVMDSLYSHMRIHGVKRLCCHICGKRFHFNASLNSHLLMHKSGEPERCEFCSKLFKTEYRLSLHIDKFCKNRYTKGRMGHFETAQKSTAQPIKLHVTRMLLFELVKMK